MYEPSSQRLVAHLPSVEQVNAERRHRGRPIDPHRLLNVLRRRRWWLLGAAVVGVALGYSVPAWMLPRAYESGASLVYEGVAEVEGVPGPGPFELGTLIDSVELPANLTAIKSTLGDERPLREIGAAIDVKVTGHSNVINVIATDETPEGAAELANATVEVFLRHRTAVERQRLEEQLAVVQQDLARSTTRLGVARREYDAFRREHGIADLGIEQQQAIEQAASFRAQADLARADADAEGARLRELEARGRRISPVVSGPEQAALQRSESDLAAARSRYSGDHPRVIALERQVTVLKQEAASASRRAVSDVLRPAASAADREAANERQQALRELADIARRRIDQLSDVEGQASTLLAAVRMAEEQLARQEARRARVEDAALNATSGFRVVSSAIAPEVPTSSKSRLAIAAAIPFGVVILALLLFGGIELRGMRLETATEVAYWSRAPVVGTTSWPRESGELEALVAELDDIVPDAAGSTLVVGATADTEPLAAELAHRLNDDWCPDELVDLKQCSIEVSEPIAVPPPQSSGVALARRMPETLALPPELAWVPAARVWQGPPSGPQIRRAVRLADRVLVVIRAGSMNAMEIGKLRVRLGREDGVGFVVVDAKEELMDAADRAGDVTAFWLQPAGARRG